MTFVIIYSFFSYIAKGNDAESLILAAQNWLINPTKSSTTDPTVLWPSKYNKEMEYYSEIYHQEGLELQYFMIYRLIMDMFKEEDLFAEFIYSKDSNSRFLKSTCDEDLLSNRFTEICGCDGNILPDFLTLVYFSMDVLDKYLVYPKMNNIGDRGIGITESSGLSYDIVREGSEYYLASYLGDLGRMSYSHQIHWSKYNVPPLDNPEKSDIEIIIKRDEMVDSTT
jgi:hypothetical protein